MTDYMKQQWKELAISIGVGLLLVLSVYARVRDIESRPHASLKELCRNAQQELNDVAIGRYAGTYALQEEEAMRGFRCALYCPYVRTDAVVE